MNGRPTVPVPKGYRVGPWEVRELLASGAFGSVYAARLAGDGDGGVASGRPAGTGERSQETADRPAETGERSSPEVGETPVGTPDRHPAADEKPAEEAADDHGTGPLPGARR